MPKNPKPNQAMLPADLSPGEEQRHHKEPIFAYDPTDPDGTRDLSAELLDFLNGGPQEICRKQVCGAVPGPIGELLSDRSRPLGCKSFRPNLNNNVSFST